GPGIRRRRMGLPASDGPHRTCLAGSRDARGRGEHPADPRHRSRGATDAPPVRLRRPRLRLRPRRCRHRRRHRVRGAHGARAVGAADRAQQRRGPVRRRRVRPAVRRHRVLGPRHQRPPEPGLPLLRDPATRRGWCV
ncbi:MAG: FIG01123682: hypothetical protein, partial [uncultured Nocardioidaceae bacterium]